MTAQDILEIARTYQPASVLAAAADLDLFAQLGARRLPAGELAEALGADPRGLGILLDALVALELLEKEGDRYYLPDGAAALLAGHGAGSVLAMLQHQANCLRRWSQLAPVVKSGRPAESRPSIRGEVADAEAFIGAMDNVSAPVADEVVRDLGELEFRHLLDVGGASGSWTIAFLRASPGSTATLFDLPHVMPMARQRLGDAGLLDRVELVPGDFSSDALPEGADLAWISAIVHMNSREQNRDLFSKTHRALVDGGNVAIRDIVMNASRTTPYEGAIFAVNMLVGTESGGTFTFAELEEDLEAAGFAEVRLARSDPGMNAVVVARR